MITDVQYRYITDIMGSIVAATSGKVEARLMQVDEYITGIHYIYGHYNEIRQKLIERSQGSESFKFRRYPLVALFLDIPNNKGRVGTGGKVTLQMIILYHTTAERYVEDRMELVFKPILYPIYNELLLQIRDSGYFLVYDVDSISHTAIERPHWGDPGLYGNSGYLFGECLDGIELKNLELTLY